jgi:beta-lactamase superfamily II metal-dependent hydrolase
MDKDKADYKVIFVDVGQGDSTIIYKLSNMHSVLIDAGSASPVLSQLKETSELEGIFITHCHNDHIAGIPAVVGWLQGNNKKDVGVYVNRQVQSSKISKRLAITFDEARENNTIILYPAYKEFPQRMALIGGCFFILWPTHENAIRHPDDKNLDSLVLRFEVEKFRLLIGGDAEGDVWSHISSDDLKADVFRYPHHGAELTATGKDSLADEIINKINPAWIVVSVCTDNPHGHPSRQFINAQSNHPEILFLDTTEGNIILQIESNTAYIKTIHENQSSDKI